MLTSISKKGTSINDLIAINPLKKQTGQRVKLVNECLSIACGHARTSKPYWRCVAFGCKHFQARNHQQSRILLHAMDCLHLSPELKDFTNNTSVSRNTLGLRVNPK